MTAKANGRVPSPELKLRNPPEHIFSPTWLIPSSNGSFLLRYAKPKSVGTSRILSRCIQDMSPWSPVSSVGGGGGVLSWAPSLGGELFALKEDCVLAAEMVIGAELWGQKGGRWNSEALYAQAEICLDAADQALLLSGQSLDVRLPLMQPHGAQGVGKSGKGGGGRGQAAAAAPPPVLGMLALSMLLHPSDEETAVTQHLPVELVPRLLLDTTRLLPGAVVRGAAGTAYVDPCVVFLRVRLISASGLGRGPKDGAAGAAGASGRSGGHAHHHHQGSGSGGGGGPGPGGLPGHLQELGARLHAQMDRTMGHVGAFLSRLKEHHARNRGGVGGGGGNGAGSSQPPLGPQQQRQQGGSGGGGDQSESVRSQAPPLQRQSVEQPGAPTTPTAAEAAAAGFGLGLDLGVGSVGGSGGGGGSAGDRVVNQAAAEAVMSLLESNGFAVVDNRRLSNYFWCKVSYEGQYHTSRLVPVAGGSVHWDETFVVAALRPVRPAPLEIELYGSNDSKSRGKVVCQLSVSMCEVMEQVAEQHRSRLRAEQEALRQQQQQHQQQQEAENLLRSHQHSGHHGPHRTAGRAANAALGAVQAWLGRRWAAASGGRSPGATGAGGGSAERSGPRPCATVGWCRLTLLLSLGPRGLPGLLQAYAEPPTYTPVAMLQEGAVAGRGLSPTLPITDPTRRVEAETLKRRERRLLVKWVSESSPGISAHTCRKLVEDGRTEFNMGRTGQNWRRIGRAWSSLEPLKRFWSHVQSWSSPPLTLAVAAGEVVLLVWPSRTIALALLVLVLRLLWVRAELLPPPSPQHGHTHPGHSHHHNHTHHRHHTGHTTSNNNSNGNGNQEEKLVVMLQEHVGSGASGSDGSAHSRSGGVGGGAGADGAGGGEDGAGADAAAHELHRGGRGVSGGPGGAPRPYLGEPGPMVDDIGAEPEAPTAAAAASGAAPQRPADGEVGVDGPSTSSHPNRTSTSGAGPGGAGGGGSIPATPRSLLSAAFAVTQSHVTGGPGGSFSASSPLTTASTTSTTAATSWIFGSSPPAAAASAAAGAAGGFDAAVPAAATSVSGFSLPLPGGAGGSEVPKDPLAALRQQYEHLVYLGLRVQNVLDDIAGGMERMQALMTWRDPVASSAFVLCTALTALVLWTTGMRVVLGAVLLYDLRPPRWRDPWLPPPANAYAQLPTRADLMM